MARKSYIAAERREMARTVGLTGTIASFSLFLAITFWDEVMLEPFWGVMMALEKTNEYLDGFLRVFVLSVFFASALVTVATLREWMRAVASWFEVIGLEAFTVALAYFMYTWMHSVSLLASCSLFVLYLYIVQER